MKTKIEITAIHWGPLSQNKFEYVWKPQFALLLTGNIMLYAPRTSAHCATRPIFPIHPVINYAAITYSQVSPKLLEIVCNRLIGFVMQTRCFNLNTVRDRQTVLSNHRQLSGFSLSISVCASHALHCLMQQVFLLTQHAILKPRQSGRSRYDLWTSPTWFWYWKASFYSFTWLTKRVPLYGGHRAVSLCLFHSTGRARGRLPLCCGKRGPLWTKYTDGQ